MAPVLRFDGWPPGLDTVDIRHLSTVIPGPALIHIKGERKERPLFLSTLLHGNETTSFHVLQTLARRYRTAPPERSMLIFVGNVEGAEKGVRVLPGGVDYNRVWGGDRCIPDGPEAAMARDVMNVAARQNPIASIDLHNTTGRNPHYGCLSRMGPVELDLIDRFSTLGVSFQNPATTQSIAFSNLCPAVTLECGQNDDQAGFEAALDVIEHVLTSETLATRWHATSSLRLYQTIGRVILKHDCAVTFGAADYGLVLDADMEAYNFQPLTSGAPFARIAEGPMPLAVVDAAGCDLTDEFFMIDGGIIRLKQAVTPAMITSQIPIIRQDCLCYLMTEIEAAVNGMPVYSAA